MTAELKPECDLVSIGKLASEIHAPVTMIERIGMKHGLLPAWRLNRVPYFERGVADAIAELIREGVRPDADDAGLDDGDDDCGDVGAS